MERERESKRMGERERGKERKVETEKEQQDLMFYE